MRRLILTGLLAGALVGCTRTVYSAAPTQTATGSPAVSVTPFSVPTPKPEKAKPVTLRGAYNGTCKILKSSGNIAAPANDNFRWHFQPAGTRILLHSKTGGYTMKLTRRTTTKFYGSANTGSGWQFAYAITVSHVADDGVGSKIHVITHESSIGGTASVSAECNGTSA